MRNVCVDDDNNDACFIYFACEHYRCRNETFIMINRQAEWRNNYAMN